MREREREIKIATSELICVHATLNFSIGLRSCRLARWRELAGAIRLMRNQLLLAKLELAMTVDGIAGGLEMLRCNNICFPSAMNTRSALCNGINLFASGDEGKKQKIKKTTSAELQPGDASAGLCFHILGRRGQSVERTDSGDASATRHNWLLLFHFSTSSTLDYLLIMIPFALSVYGCCIR